MALPGRLQVALAPTPILKLERPSRQLGVELFVKHDLTGPLDRLGRLLDGAAPTRA